MKIIIEYCVTCNYRPVAAVLSLAIYEALGIKPVLVNSKETCALAVIVDGETIFSKTASGFFPTKEQIIDILKKRRDSSDGVPPP